MNTSAARTAGCCIVLLCCTAVASADPDLRLIQATKKLDVAQVRALLARKVDVNAAEGDGATALHWAVHRDSVPLTELLIRAGAGIDATNQNGVTPLALACSNANAAMVRTLLRAKANPRAALPSGETALMACARTGDADAVRELLKAGAEVDARQRSRGQTARRWAAAERHATVARSADEL